MDDILIREARNGSQEALAQLLYKNYNILFKYLVKFTFNVNLAEDLTQETMVKAIEKIDLYDPEKSKFSTWLIAIAQNTYMDYLRRVKREKKYFDADVLFEQLKGHMEIHDDSFDCILDALAKLPDESRFPLLLKHYHGYSYEDIAHKMGIPLGTVKSRIHNALKILRKELE